MGDLRMRAETGRGGAMKKVGYLALHAVAATAFMFLVQRYTLNASLENSLIWAVGFGACAAGLAYTQLKR